MSPDSNSIGIVAAQQLSAGCHDLDKLLQALAATNEDVADGTFAKRVHAARKLGKSLRGGFAIMGQPPFPLARPAPQCILRDR